MLLFLGWGCFVFTSLFIGYNFIRFRKLSVESIYLVFRLFVYFSTISIDHYSFYVLFWSFVVKCDSSFSFWHFQTIMFPQLFVTFENMRRPSLYLIKLVKPLLYCRSLTYTHMGCWDVKMKIHILDLFVSAHIPLCVLTNKVVTNIIFFCPLLDLQVSVFPTLLYLILWQVFTFTCPRLVLEWLEFYITTNCFRFIFFTAFVVSTFSSIFILLLRTLTISD